ncbi:polyphenol oxidase family protein [Aeromicrobium sp. UC242_57]|uniref:polyphenol oxidase family protein n=1 Tax=Aeromicrobium sp. UC242_57 TaxID=3374624 RepID=UPI0037A13AD9
MFWNSQTSGKVDLAFTDREGGVSHGPWGSLNLGTSNGDDPALVDSNLARVAEALGVRRLVRMTQVHGASAAWVEDVAPGEIPEADVLLSRTPGVGLLVRVADCTPVVIAATDESLVAVVHCGRAGLLAGVVPAAVDELRAHGATALQAWVGPRACGRCYELPQEMVDDVAQTFPDARSTTSWGTPAVDVGAGVLSRLAALDVQTTDLAADECTIEDERWFSYRRQGQDSGRFGAVAVIR